MRRQNFYLLVLAVSLLLLPMSKDNRVLPGVADYINDVSFFLEFLLDPALVAAPVQDKVLAGILIVQTVGWILFAVCLLFIALFGIVRNQSSLKVVAILSGIVLVHGVIEVWVSASFVSVPMPSAIFMRFGLDLSDFIDDYDALLNSTIVPVGLIIWYVLSRRATSKTHVQETASVRLENPT